MGGSIKVRMKTEIAGEKVAMLPYTEQYTLLHTHLYKYLSENDFGFCLVYKKSQVRVMAGHFLGWEVFVF